MFNIETEAQLEDALSTPSGADIDAMRVLAGDIMVLGAGGKMGPALANTMMGINVRDLLARIDAIGKDLTVRGSSKVPHIRISSAKITSGE